jgi:hypothetical protein
MLSCSIRIGHQGTFCHNPQSSDFHLLLMRQTLNTRTPEPNVCLTPHIRLIQAPTCHLSAQICVSVFPTPESPPSPHHGGVKTHV